MRTPGSWIAILVLSGILAVGTDAQETENALVTPDKVTVKVERSRTLHRGEDFSFQLHFDPAPDGYGRGTIFAVFKHEGSPPSFDQFPGNPKIWLEESRPATDELHDGQTIYTLTLPIREPMPAGKWKLAEVSIGLSTRKIIPLSEEVSFIVAELQPLTVHIEAPPSVEAGNVYEFTVTLDRYPTDISKNCKLHLMVGGSRPDFGFPPVEILPGRLSYPFAHQFEPDSPGGLYKLEAYEFAYLRENMDRGCWMPKLQGNLHAAFNVEPSRKLVTPTSVAVTVNPSQIELLRGEADRLRAKERHLREQLASQDSSAQKIVLQSTLREALAELEQTKNKFIDLQKGAEPTSGNLAKTFFDDIKRTYNDAWDALAKTSASLSHVPPTLRQVHYAFGERTLRLYSVSDAALESILHNAAAYDVVALSKSLTFTLEVISQPKGATISYKLRGEDYRELGHETDWRIENLARAVYFVRVHKNGYQEKEKLFDAIKETGTSISFELERKSSKQ